MIEVVFDEEALMLQRIDRGDDREIAAEIAYIAHENLEWLCKTNKWRYSRKKEGLVFIINNSSNSDEMRRATEEVEFYIREAIVQYSE